MLKLAVDCRMIGSGGIGSYISEIIPHLLKYAQCVLIGTHEQCMDFVRLENVEFCFCDVPPFSLKELFAFPDEVLAKINSCNAYYTPYCNIPANIRVPVFSTIHDVVFFDMPELTSRLGRFARKLFYKRAIHRSQVVFTVSEFSKQRIEYHLHCKKPLVITYNAAPKYITEPFEEPVEKADEILFVGNIKKHKGLSTLLEAFNMARQKGLSSKLVIVGNAENFRTSDADTMQLLENARQNGNDSIVFTGRITNDELKKHYARAKLLVQPSLYEGFGIPPLEAMTVGTPALISDIPVFKEVYSAYPVTFFKANDAADLADKLLAAKCETVDIRDMECGFSYESSAQTILETIEKRIASLKNA